MSDPTGDIGAALTAAFSASTPDASATGSDTTTPASASSTPGQTDPAAAPQTSQEEPGPVPYLRFKEVNEKAKLTASELEKLAWAKAIRAEHGQPMVEFYNRVSQNPLSLLEEVEFLLQRPDTAPAVRSWAARTLGTRLASQPTAPAEEQEPPPDIQLEDGRAVYSAGQLAKREAWLQKQWDARMDEKLKPFQQDRQLSQEERATRIFEQKKVEARESGRQEVEALKVQPNFEELKPRMVEILTADTDLKITPKEAYAQAFIEVIVPKLSAGKAAALQQKVGASSANPSRPSGASLGPPKDFREALERMHP